jgi:hypothetical protein
MLSVLGLGPRISKETRLNYRQRHPSFSSAIPMFRGEVRRRDRASRGGLKAKLAAADRARDDEPAMSGRASDDTCHVGIESRDQS